MSGAANGVSFMKINPISSYNVYQSSYKRAVRRLASPVSAESAGKTDTISFSPEAVGQRDISQAAGSILRELNSPESTSRLLELQKAVENGTYRVSTDDLADAILSRSYFG